MKKTLTMLLAFILCLSCACALAEATDENAVTVSAVENGLDTLLDPIGLSVTLPAGWQQAQTPENYVAVYQSADETLTLSVLLGQSLNACHALIVEQEENNAVKDVTEQYVNDRYFLTYRSADDLYFFAYLPISEENCVIFCFARSAADVALDVPLQILGSVHW